MSLFTTVLVVGSGPAGLWLALELRHSGIDVLVIDSKVSSDARDPYSKALTISAGSLATFDSRGLAQPFLAEGIPLPKAHFGGLETMLDLNHEVLGVRYPHALAIPQARVELILLGKCVEAGVRFAWGHKFLSLVQAQDAVVATVARVSSTKMPDDETVNISAKWLVGCDGTHSMVRPAARISFDGTPSNVTGVLADCQLTAPSASRSGFITQRSSKGTVMIVKFGEGTNHRLALVMNDSLHRPATEAPTMDEIRQHLVNTFGSDLGAHSPVWMSRFGNASRLASSFRAGRVFLAGDAAHEFFPAGGQGMNVGLQDATNLAWKLVMATQLESGNTHARSPALERILDSYSRERLQVATAATENVQAQLACFLAGSKHDNALRSVMAEALKMRQLNVLWARRMSGFGEPRASYLTDAKAEDGLVGTVFSHLRVDSEGEDVPCKLALDRFILLFREDIGDAANHVDLKAEAARWARVNVVASQTTSSDSRWEGVYAVLVRPDLRIAWCCRTGVSPLMAKSSLATILRFWLG